MNIQVLLIEDDPMVREVNRQFIEQVSGFQIVGTANNGVDGVELIKNLKPDLVFMDIYMPKQDGIETLRIIRAEMLPVDVIAVTAANDIVTIQKLLHLGVFDYIMKPFSFERIKHTLKNYRIYFEKMAQQQQDLSQDELDALLQHEIKMKPVRQILPKGLNGSTLKKILQFIGNELEPVSAEDVANGVGLARVTARRYLEYLEKEKQVTLEVQYGGIGRPINRYQLL